MDTCSNCLLLRDRGWSLGDAVHDHAPDAPGDGGAGSGKTTLLGVLSGFISDEERLITIEDAAELRLAKPHVVSLGARPANVEGRGEITVRHLVRNALRMRPDRIIAGEVRGGEALDMLQAMNTGHEEGASARRTRTG
jgi:pilus assembly protein CpaF